MQSIDMMKISFLGLIILNAFILASTNKRVDVWRQSLCEKQADPQVDEAELFNDTRACYKLKAQVYQDAMSDCATVSLPASNGDPFVIMSRGCTNDTIFKNFDECFERYEANADFMSQAQLSDEEKSCFGAVVQKYSLQIGSVSADA